MNITSLHFALFFIITALLYFALPQQWRWLLLLVASYYFYMCSKPSYAVVLLATTCVSYTSALLMDRRQAGKSRLPFLLIGLLGDLGLLLSFKYLDFFLQNAGNVLSRFNLVQSSPTLKWLVPLGISFYTLQTLSYLFDVYGGKMKAEKHFGYLAVYVSFFPTVSAGPIERGAHLVPQLHEKHRFDYDRTVYSLKLITWGLFKKMVIADNLALVVDQVYGNVRQYRGFVLLVATFFFAVQLYADFSGYTDIVRGCASIMGFDLVINFNLPYFARSVREFWRRWHISMTSWFRDYLYVPLGGDRRGGLRTYANVLIVFLVSGLWHGANWTFIVWGAMHGAYYTVGRATSTAREKVWRRAGIPPDGRAASVMKAVFTFLLVDFAWIFFRSESLGDAFYVVRHIFDLRSLEFPLEVGLGGLALDVALVLVFLAVELVQLRGPLIEAVDRQHIIIRWALYCAAVLAVLLLGVAGSMQFVYVRF